MEHARMITRREALQRVALLMGGAVAAPTAAGVLAGCRAGSDAAWSPVVLEGTQADLVRAVVGYILPETESPGAVEAGVPAFIDRMLAEWYPEELRRRFLDGLADLNQRAQDLNGQDFLDLATDQQYRLVAELDRETFARGDEPVRDDVREQTQGPGEDPLDEPVEEPGDDPYGADSVQADSVGADSVQADTTRGSRLSPEVDGILADQIQNARERAAERAAEAAYVRADVAHEGSIIGDPSFFHMLKELTLVGYYTSEPGATEELDYEPVPGRWDACLPYDDIGATWAV